MTVNANLVSAFSFHFKPIGYLAWLVFPIATRAMDCFSTFSLLRQAGVSRYSFDEIEVWINGSAVDVDGISQSISRRQEVFDYLRNLLSHQILGDELRCAIYVRPTILMKLHESPRFVVFGQGAPSCGA